MQQREKQWRVLNKTWETPLEYWRSLSKAIAHAVRPAGPRDRLLRKCRLKDVKHHTRPTRLNGDGQEDRRIR